MHTRGLEMRATSRTSRPTIRVGPTRRSSTLDLALDPCADLVVADDVERERAVVSIGDVVAIDGGVMHLDALLVEGVDPVAALVDEPLERLALCRPALMRRDVTAFVRRFDPARELEEGQV